MPPTHRLILLFAAVELHRRKAIPIPIDYEEKQNRLRRSFVDDVFHATRNHFDFWSALTRRTRQTFQESGNQRDAGEFWSCRGRSSMWKTAIAVHLILGRHRMYNRERSFNSWDYFANAQYRYELSTRTSSDQRSFTSSTTTLGRLFRSFSDPAQPGFNDLSTGRITRNAAVAQLNL